LKPESASIGNKKRKEGIDINNSWYGLFRLTMNLENKEDVKMKKNVWFVLFVGICLVFALPVISSAKVITLTLTDQNSEVGWGPVHALQPWVKQVEKAAKGQVKINIYPSQTLSKGKDNWNAVKNGIADIGWCFHGYWPGLTSLADVISLPAMPFKSAEKGSEVLWKLYEKFPSIQKQFKDNHILLLYTSNPYMLITTKKQVKTLDDVKGLKIRMPGGPPTEQMKALGGVPMMIPMPDNYISLQKGVIDGMGAPWEAILGFRLYEVVKYYTEAPLPAVYFSVAFNKKKWNSLPKEIQDAFTSVSGLEGSKFWGRNFFDSAKDGIFQKTGVEINYYALPDVERVKWLAIGGKPIWTQWVKSMKGKGLSDAQEILDSALEMLK
jgi:TRAP-type C4-dicarboxylate transport system substrate-binding protein